jgi:hypothetical protein
MFKKQTVTIQIVYNAGEYKKPSDWDWAALLDLETNAMVQVVDSTEPKEIE